LRVLNSDETLGARRPSGAGFRRTVTPLVAVLAVLATYRATLLVTSDTVTDRPRTWVLRRWPSSPVAYWVTCNWCASMTVGAVVVGSALAWSNGWGWLLVAGTLSASAVTGLLSEYATP
jgi:hypothetical protein